MSLFNKPQLKKIARSNIPLRKSAEYLKENVKDADTAERFDIFLSHRYMDADYIAGLAIDFENLGYSVFVDWIENPKINRRKVNRKTAGWLRKIMNRCECLFYAISENSEGSAWMPWELGYSDGRHGRVAIVPILEQDQTSEAYRGQEYLSLYPYVTKNGAKSSNQQGNLSFPLKIKKQELFINFKDEYNYVALPAWLNGKPPKFDWKWKISKELNIE